MAARVTGDTSDATHLAGDSTQSENKHFAGMAANRFYGQYLPRIGDMDQNFGDEGEVTIEVVELWELEKCKCPEGTPPMRKLVPGEKTLRCSECGRPARKPSTD